ncbi:MAG: choloylglycine hydrolase [Lachnospiraceae bacterium]|nr:choloylglycine hydrolase [Lachnospiraceae bacterium]
MCTSIAMTTKDFYFGRNLDLEYEFGERVIVTPRNYPFSFRKAGELPKHYALIGIGTVLEGYPLYAEAANEKGLCMAGLNFPGNAYYPPEEATDKANVSPFELIPWLLGSCSTVAEARERLERVNLIGIPFSEQTPLSPLHWHIADRERSIVLESTKAGITIYENPVGVMTNNPTFDFHLLNLSQYMNLTTTDPEEQFKEKTGMKPFGWGFGGIGLPGDTSTASRFVRTSFLKLNSVCEDDEASSVSQFFHLLDAASMVRGSVTASAGRYEITSYSCCINAAKGIFYYKTYGNNQLTAVDMHRENLKARELKEYPLQKKQQILWMN